MRVAHRKYYVWLTILWFLTSFVGSFFFAKAQVPVNVVGHVFMPDSSPASGASVSASGGGDSNSATTDINGFYEIPLTVSSVPVYVIVTASKDGYSGSASTTGEGTINIDVHLSATPPPPPTKKPVSLSINLPSEAAVNTTLKITGSVSPFVSPVYFDVIDALGSRTKTTVVVGSDGSFSYSFVPHMIGLYAVSASYPGDADHESASTPVYYIAVKAKGMLTLSVEPNTIVLGVDRPSFRGSISPKSARPIILYYSGDNRTWSEFTELAPSDGRFSTTWDPKLLGNVYVKAEWIGNATYYGASAYVLLTVVVPSLPVVELTQVTSGLNVGERGQIAGTIAGLSSPEGVNVTLFVYRGPEKADELHIPLVKDFSFSSSWQPTAPGFYLLVFEVSGRYVVTTRLATSVVVLGEVLIQTVDSAGGQVLDASVELKDASGVVKASDTGALTFLPRFGTYEITVKDRGIELFNGSLAVTDSGMVLTRGSSQVEFPLPTAMDPEVIHLGINISSLIVFVVNEFGEPMKGTSVKLNSPYLQISAESDANGSALFQHIPHGTYEVVTPAETKVLELVKDETIMMRGSSLDAKMIMALEAVAFVCAAGLAGYLYLRRFRGQAQERSQA